MALESLEAARTSSKEVLKKTAIATGNIIVSIDLAWQVLFCTVQRPKKTLLGKREQSTG